MWLPGPLIHPLATKALKVTAAGPEALQVDSLPPLKPGFMPVGKRTLALQLSDSDTAFTAARRVVSNCKEIL